MKKLCHNKHYQSQGVSVNIVYGLIIVFTLLIGTNINAYAVPQLLKVSDKRSVEFRQFMEDIERSDVIFIGETHDVIKQHENQLDIIRGLYSRKIPVAIGLEMFSTDSQQQLDDWSKGKLDEQDFKTAYARNWSYDWQLYRAIFIFARDNHIPMIALNVPKPIISKIMRQGSAALDENDKKELPPHFSWTLNPPQTEYLRRITAQVFKNKPGVMPLTNFCEAQALRNNVMAWSISKYRNKFPTRKVIAIAGTWHAIKNGAPEQLKQYGSLSDTVILPELPEFVIQNVTPNEADYIILK
jgi:uncharacterized iron-regulated protein